MPRGSSPGDRRDAETALTAMLDDPSPMVRHALADTLADSPEAPRHLIVALANDRGAVADMVLARSPVLTDADLIDCAALGDERSRRPSRAALMCRSPRPPPSPKSRGPPRSPRSPRTPAPRSPTRACGAWSSGMRPASPLRQALQRRPHLPLDIRHAVAVAASDQLPASVDARMDARPAGRAVSDVRDRATVALTATASPEDVQRLVAYLRRTGQLTPALMLRALLSRSMAFVEAAFADLARLPAARVAGLLHDRRRAGFPALLDRAGLPEACNRPLKRRSPLAGRRRPRREPRPAQLSRRLVERVLAACAALKGAGKLMALLRRYEAEAAREAARDAAGLLADEAVLALEYKPAALIGTERLRDAA